MKTFRRNAVIITVVLFVCVAAYLNWSYSKTEDSGAQTNVTAGQQDGGGKSDDSSKNENGDEGKSENSDNTGSQDSGLYYDPEGTEEDTNVSDYFATARINREKARDSAAETLATVSSAEGASQEIIDAALTKISAIAADSQKEAELEALIMAKGYGDCVVFISDDGIKVTLPAPSEGLSTAAVAQVTDIITRETDYKAADLRIIEVK